MLRTLESQTQCWDFSRLEKETHNQPDKRIARHHNAQGMTKWNGDDAPKQLLWSMPMHQACLQLHYVLSIFTSACNSG